MKTTVLKLALIGAVLSVSVGNAMAYPGPRCGQGTPVPCEIPEPSTAYLFLAAAGVAAAVAKFRKK